MIEHIRIQVSKESPHTDLLHSYRGRAKINACDLVIESKSFILVTQNKTTHCCAFGSVGDMEQMVLESIRELVKIDPSFLGKLRLL